MPGSPSVACELRDALAGHGKKLRRSQRERSAASLTDKLTPLSGVVSDVMATSALCYAY